MSKKNNIDFICNALAAASIVATFSAAVIFKDEPRQCNENGTPYIAQIGWIEDAEPSYPCPKD